MPTSVRHQSIPKPDSQSVQNEDSVKIDESKGLFFLSDGAGGTGVESHLWSRYLVDHLTEHPINNSDEFINWYDSVWEAHFEKLKISLQRSNPDAIYKLYTEGSSATLVAAWLEGKEVKWLTYGDSVFMHLSVGDNYSTIDCNVGLEDFLQNPLLLNFLDSPLIDGLKIKSTSLNTGDVLILASDAIGQYLLGLHNLFHEGPETKRVIDSILCTPYRSANLLENQKMYLSDGGGIMSWQSELDKLWDALSCEETFRQHTNECLNHQILAIDDYSVIMLKIE